MTTSKSRVQPDTFPSSRLGRWLVAPRSDADGAIAAQLTTGLYASLPIFLGGVFNSVAVAAVGAIRHPTIIFLAWLITELLLMIVRITVLVHGRRARAAGRTPLITLSVLLSCVWAASVGFGALISIRSEDWVLAIISCLSAAAMVAGICLRNFGTPRLVAIMMMLSLVPCAVAALFSSQSILIVVAVQLPIFMAAIGSSAFRLNGMLVGRMAAQANLEQSEAFVRSILDSSPDYTLVVSSDGVILFLKRPNVPAEMPHRYEGLRWLDTVPRENRKEAKRALRQAQAGETARLIVRNETNGDRRWFDVAVSPILDGSGQLLIVARDITHQKTFEEQALWMANHDPLTELPNRILLQAELESRTASQSGRCALLMLDVDNFKLINDAFGHDSGDALLCAFALRLRTAVGHDGLVARLGGDEFAIVIRAQNPAEVRAVGDRIFAELNQPFAHNGRMLECNASMGASLYPRDGACRSELMKAADIALYCAKAAGRGQLKIFESAMRNDVQSQTSMIFMARRALASDDMLPFYQPKVRLRTGEIVGFEALLRWKDSGGQLRLPDKLHAAFDDPMLSAAIGDRMIEKVLADMRRWLDEGVEFGHVAINASAAAFRSGKLAEQLLEQLRHRRIPARCLQVEVTETVFLGRGADHVKRVLRQLRAAGVRIALDDFGTGYASLAHLMQFPVDALKIDRSFIKGIGRRNEEAEAITKAILNLGQTLGIEIVAEGIETAEQEMHLIGLGCQTGQGYLYSKAAPAHAVSEMLVAKIAKSA